MLKNLLILLSFIIFTNVFAQQISVDSYGARPDGITDSTKAFQAAIDIAIQSQGSIQKIVLSAGTYFLKCSIPIGGGPAELLEWPINESSKPKIQPQSMCLNINGAKNISLEGVANNKTEILIGNNSSGLVLVQSSQNITLKSFSVDYKTLPFTQGVIKAVDLVSKSIEVAIDNGYTSFDQAIFSDRYYPENFGIILEGNSLKLKVGTLGYYKNLAFSKNSNGNWNIALDSSNNWITGNIAIGDHFVLPLRVSSVFTFYRSNNLTLQNVNIYSGPGAATIWAENLGKIEIDGLQVRVKAGTNRLLSTAADAIHMADNNAKITISNSYFEGMADDAINIYNKGSSIVSTNKNSFVINKFLSSYSLGQNIQVTDINSKVLGEGKIIGLNNFYNSSEFLLESTSAFNVDNTVYNYELASPNAVIKNNIFANFRGMLRIRSKEAVFSKNTFLDSVNAKIFVDADPYYQEGPSLISAPKSLPILSEITLKEGSLDLLDNKYNSISASTGCQVNVGICNTNSSLNGIVNDTYNNSNSIQENCLLRAQDFVNYCKSKNEVKAMFTRNGVEVASKLNSPITAGPISVTSCQVNVGVCTTNASLNGIVNDTYNNSNSIQANCLLRAQDFANYCKSKNEVKAMFMRDGVEVASKTISPFVVEPIQVTSCQVNVGICYTNSSLNGIVNDSYNNSNTIQANCLLRAQDFVNYCKSKTTVTASFLKDGAIIGSKSVTPK